ncbi:MAG: DUF4102 domain-containing protein [Gammaproteobacteria bacterium]|nr:DUF4102 domain-containing protein [Gammaproteobacteria bacterium]
MALSDTAVRKAKSSPKARKLADERGLFLYLAPAGGKYWRFKYRFDGKEKLLSFGIYPDVSLTEAREKRDEARRYLAKRFKERFKGSESLILRFKGSESLIPGAFKRSESLILEV